MKRILIGIISATLTCGIGIYLFQNINSSFEDISCEECAELHSRPISDITFAKLYEKQDDFEGQVVRVNVTLTNNDNNTWISDNLRQNSIFAGFNVIDSCKACNSAKKKINGLGNGLFGAESVKTTIVGRLEKNRGNTINAKFSFKILCIEKVW